VFSVIKTQWLGNFFCRTYYFIWTQVTVLEYELPYTNPINTKHAQVLLQSNWFLYTA